MPQEKTRSKTTVPKRPNEGASHSRGQGVADTRQAEPVRLFLAMVDPVTSAHVPLDATSSQSTRTRPSTSLSGDGEPRRVF